LVDDGDRSVFRPIEFFQEVDGDDAAEHQHGHHGDRKHERLGANHGSIFAYGDGPDFIHGLNLL
jgi:hypothetical protein